ncbi:MAG: undecaprenyl-diphosphate phosphatase [Chitinispirillia bacterium]|nr:undecaprenyl-diphosphate phosphatase [Chitinispirillia bacterium]MCL2240923.1 undecaprenyl-diphosphate phosphatase [Chitinispirillia bacterium]
METLKTLLLGIIQGFTEFLPVSSSGHLILAQTFMGVDKSGMVLEVVLHLATGIAVLWVFRKDIIGIITGCVSKDTLVRKDSLTYSWWIILGTVPATLVAFYFKFFTEVNYIEELFDTSKGTMPAYLTSFMLFITAGLLFFSSWKKDAGADGGKLTLMRVLAIGVMQAIAITPGISRSGSTIAVALLVGVARTEAGRFSFMLALPAIFGAALLDAKDVTSWGEVLTLDLAIGFIASLVIGVISLKLLLTFIQKGKLRYFAYYCVAAAVVSLVCLTLGFGGSNNG